MANLAKTISNSINCLGPDQTQLWGGAGAFPMVWGTSKWGSRAMYTQISYELTIANALSYDSAIYKSVQKLIQDNIDNAMETGSETLQTGNGYYYVFIKPSENAENRPTNTYVAVTANQPVYTSSTVTTVWS